MQTPSATSVGRKKDGLPPSARPQAAPYKPTFADRDMAVNKMYARYQERFGAAASNPGTPSAKNESQNQAQSQQQAREEGKVNSRSPEMLDEMMMMESTGMQRSSVQVSPPAIGVASQPTTSKLEQRIQERMQVLGQRLQSKNQDLQMVTAEPPQQQQQQDTHDQQSFQGSFQRTIRLPVPQPQPVKPNQHLNRFMIEKQGSLNAMSAGQNSVSGDQTGTSIGVDEQPTSTSRLRSKLADYLSPTAETRDKLGAQAMRQVHQKQSNHDALYDIKKRQHARKLLNTLEQTWTPNITRIKHDAFQTIQKQHGRVDTPQVKNAIMSAAVDPAAAYESVQSFGIRTSNEKQVDSAGVALLEQTASFDLGNDCNLPSEDIPSGSKSNILFTDMSAKQKNISPKLQGTMESRAVEADNTGLKSRFLAAGSGQKSNWRSTTSKSSCSGGGNNSRPEEEPASKSTFDFKLLENVAQNKFDQLASIQVEAPEKIITVQRADEDTPVAGSSSQPAKLTSFVLKTQPQNMDFTKEVEFQQIGTGYVPSFNNQQQSHSVDVLGLDPPVTKPMLSPSSKQSAEDGYQYPKEDSLAMYSAENRSSRVQPRHYYNYQLALSHNRPSMQVHHELGEAPVSAQPTEFTYTNTNNDSQILTSNPDLKSMNGQPFNLSDNKTAKLLSPMEEDNSIDNRRDYSEIDPPMKLEFLQDGESAAAEQEYAGHHQREESMDEVLEGIQAPPSTDQFLKVDMAIQLGKDAVMTALGGGGGDSGTSAGSTKLDRLAPLRSIFSGEALERAKQVNKNVDEKIAKIKAMQEQILRPRDTKSRSSVRSGRQMSDHDYNQLTEKLGMVSLRQVHASDMGSEIDDVSSSNQSNYDRLRGSNAATLEYFCPGSAAKRQTPAAKHRRNKKSLDLKESGLKSLDFSASVPVQSSLVESSLQSLSKSAPPKDENIYIVSTPPQQEEKLFQPRFTKQKSSGASSFVATEDNNKEVRKLRMQNGLLILSKRFAQHATVAKQVFLHKWRSKVHKQKEIMAKFIQIIAKQGNAIAQLDVKRGLETWKTAKNTMLNEEIQIELQAITKTQRRILENIQKSYTNQNLLKTRARIFHSWLELYNSRKQAHDSKQEACKRLERVLRRQVRKRKRNFWKALNRLPFVSDLADEEDYSVFSGMGRANSINGFYYKSNTSPLGQARSMSSRNNNCSPSPLMGTPSYSRTTTLERQDSANIVPRSLEGAQIAKIKGGVKLLTVSVNRQLSQNKEPDVKDLFSIWKIRAHFQSKGATPTHLGVKSSIDSWRKHKPQMSATIVVEDPIEMVQDSQLLIKQASFRDKPNKQLTDVYERPRPEVENNTSKSVTPEHEVRADINNMLDNDDPKHSLSDQQSSTEDKENNNKSEEANNEDEVVTTSDISSVQLDSDDSCFAATVEVIKLAPVKKTKQQMPTTTNVSQIDQTDGKHSRQEFQSVSTDRGEKEQLLLDNMEEDRNELLDDDKNISRTPPIDAFSLQSTEGPNEAVESRQGKKGSLGHGARKSIPTPRMMAEVVSKALSVGRSQETVVHSSPSRKGRNDQKRLNVLRSENVNKGGNGVEQKMRKGQNNHSFNQLTLFSKKSSSVQSKPISLSSDPFKKDADTPQFRRSEISNRQRSQASQQKEDPYYELTEPLPTIKQKEQAKKRAKQRQPSTTSAADQEKQNLMVKLAKVAQAQIAAEAALQEEKQREKNRLLSKERDRKTNLLFQKKILRGVPNLLPPTLSNVNKAPTSQLLAGMVQSSQAAQMKKKGNQKKSVTRNPSIKTSFISVTQATQVMNNRTASKHRSEIVTPRKRVVSTKQKRARDLSTASNASKKAVKRVNIDACLTNSLSIKMPFGGGVQQQDSIVGGVPSSGAITSRFSDVTSRSYQVHSHYGTMTSNPFQKAAGVSQPKKKSQTRHPSNLKRNGSKSSLRSINDRPLQTTYVPPVYKSRAFRSRRRNSLSKNSDITAKDHASHEQISACGTAIMLMTNPQIQIEEQKVSMLETHMQMSESSPLQYQTERYEHYLLNKDDQQLQEEEGDDNEGQSPQQTNIMVTQHSELQADQQDAQDDQDDQDGMQIIEQTNPVEDRQIVDPEQDLIMISDNQLDDGVDADDLQHYQDTPAESNSVRQPGSEQRHDQETPAESSVRHPDSEQRHEQQTPAWICDSTDRNTNEVIDAYSNNKKYNTDGVMPREDMPMQPKWNSARHLLATERQPLSEVEETKEAADSDQPFNNQSAARKSSRDVQSSHGDNFSLFKSQGGSPSEMLQVPDRRMTFGKASDQMTAAQQESSQWQQELEPELAQANVQAYQAGLQRLEGALFHRLERYKVELFIHLCEALDSNDGDEEGQESDGEEVEDVYGSGNYQMPQRLSNPNNQFNQYYNKQ